MKKRLTIKDIEQLSYDQKQNLIALWMPEIYDVAVASICKDITTDEYESYEFVVGKIEIINGRRILVHDIKSLVSEPSGEDSEAQNDPTDDSSNGGSLSEKKDVDLEIEGEDEEEYSAEDEEFDIDYDYTRPSSFIKEECLPLLNIGQMLDILQRSSSGKSGFYMTAYTNDMSCEIGTDNMSVDRYEMGFTEAELCEVLWESLRTLL